MSRSALGVVALLLARQGIGLRLARKGPPHDRHRDRDGGDDLQENPAQLAAPFAACDRTLSSIAAAAVAAAIAGCASAPSAPQRPADTALLCPPAPACPAPGAPAPAPRAARLEPVPWSELPGWGREPLAPALEAFLRGCAVLERQDRFAAACAAAREMPAQADARTFFEAHFAAHRVVNADETTVGMVTGYYEPVLRGSRSRSARYRYPLYGVPDDLVVVDLAEVHPDLRHRRLRGRLVGKRVVPYLARGEIDHGQAPLAGKEIAWVDDAVEAFFLHIQGSGQVQLESGERLRLGYAEHNGHPFRSLGAHLIRSGELAAERASMQGIKEWAKRNPARAQAFLNENPSYVFFRELPRDLPGPIGALGVALTAGRSIAVDPRVVPLGVPVYLATTHPNTAEPLARLMVAQDTGGAITGGVRADFYWGTGDAAGSLAGRMRQAGRMWVLLPGGKSP